MTIALETAKDSIRHYRSLRAPARRERTGPPDTRTELLAQHREALECWDCDDLLRLGVEAFAWIRRAEENLSAAVRQGAPYDPDMEQTLTELYEQWLEPCEAAEEWAKEVRSRGYELKHLDEFRRVWQEAQDTLEQRAIAHQGLSALIAASEDEEW